MALSIPTAPQLWCAPAPILNRFQKQIQRERTHHHRFVKYLVVCNAGKLELADGTGEWKWEKSMKQLAAYGALLAAAPVVPLLPRFEWSASLYFISLSLWTVYVGSHRSLAMKQTQQLSLKQGVAAPLICSASLFGFYCLLRFFPDLDLKTFISIYLSFAGAFAVTNNLANPLKLLFPQLDNIPLRIELPLWLVKDRGNPVSIRVTLADVLALLVGIGISIVSRQPGAPYTFNNLIAVCIVTELLQLVSIGSFSTASVLLSGLLLYDVFWVFGSSHIFGDNVMVTVATSSAFEGPVKLVFPSWNPNAAHGQSILGLGDIAAPGLLISLMLRFDKSKSTENESSPRKTYFSNSIIAYAAGLVFTIVANSFSGAAQPALLYLVPSLLLTVMFTAVSRSETPLLLDYRDVDQV